MWEWAFFVTHNQYFQGKYYNLSAIPGETTWHTIYGDHRLGVQQRAASKQYRAGFVYFLEFVEVVLFFPKKCSHNCWKNINSKFNIHPSVKIWIFLWWMLGYSYEYIRFYWVAQVLLVFISPRTVLRNLPLILLSKLLDIGELNVR